MNDFMKIVKSHEDLVVLYEVVVKQLKTKQKINELALLVYCFISWYIGIQLRDELHKIMTTIFQKCKVY